MSLLTIVVTLVVVGLLLWLINTYVPMQGAIKFILNLIVVAAVVIWLLYGLGIISQPGNIQIPGVK